MKHIFFLLLVTFNSTVPKQAIAQDFHEDKPVEVWEGTTALTEKIRITLTPSDMKIECLSTCTREFVPSKPKEQHVKVTTYLNTEVNAQEEVFMPIVEDEDDLFVMRILNGQVMKLFEEKKKLALARLDLVSEKRLVVAKKKWQPSDLQLFFGNWTYESDLFKLSIVLDSAIFSEAYESLEYSIDGEVVQEQENSSAPSISLNNFLILAPHDSPSFPKEMILLYQGPDSYEAYNRLVVSDNVLNSHRGGSVIPPLITAVLSRRF